MSDKTIIVSDVDGCLVPGRGVAWDFVGLAEIAARNQKREKLFTLCSSRPATFIEAIARQLQVTNYCICENGSILFNHLTKDILINPQIPQDYLNEYKNIEQILKELVKGSPALVEFGKSFTFSVNMQDEHLLPTIFNAVFEKLKGAPVSIFRSQRSVEVMPQGINKKIGLQFWAEVEKVKLDQVLAIGDAENDLEILEAAERSAAPSNAIEVVKKIVTYVSPFPMVQGVLDIYRRADQLS